MSLPTSRTGDVAVAASYTVAEWRDPQPTDVPDDELVDALAARSDALASVVDVDGQPALREELVEEDAPDGSASGLQPRRARRVSYTIAGPSEERTWVLFTFSTLGDGDPDGPLARVLVEPLDAHVGTLRWELGAGA
ncbi:hypothetical protein [Curtobacterium sp. Leaf261]|uniref:hypothetical protein n=1 Tax=Curtobacterium sp. Leaf261 TaxID=1736311 RepID=UPI0006F79004|nr:hypothetical protein [Curtobacterium sp. Leaf261]KQO59753.1 hypothetical protein ASF23_15815 [Curtobacterium sp. Leaf261]